MTQMMTFNAIQGMVADMVATGFIALKDASYAVNQWLRGNITERECVDMLQELVDVATIKKLSH